MTRCKTFEEHMQRVADLRVKLCELLGEPEQNYCYAMAAQALAETIGIWLAWEEDDEPREAMFKLVVEGIRVQMDVINEEVKALVEKREAEANGKLQ